MWRTFLVAEWNLISHGLCHIIGFRGFSIKWGIFKTAKWVTSGLSKINQNINCKWLEQCIILFWLKKFVKLFMNIFGNFLWKIANKICFYFSGPKKSPGGNSNPNRLSCNLAFKDSESQQKDLESFNTKDSSDSKSHDSGIDSIEKPGKNIL